MELDKVYNPQAVESKWYRYWEENGYFYAPLPLPGQKRFSLMMPPPNVTGSLHLGHALDITLQDIFTRWYRMRGYVSLWLPGTDHAGIATQVKVEEALAREGLTKHHLGREKFLERVWAWKEQYGNTITRQLRLLGASCDWSRERFTMDPAYTRSVRHAFVHLYHKGLIYRDRYIINWCPRCQTTLSDLEVEYREIQGKLWYISYPLEDGSGSIVVATTRPETMLGDTAVAVHPGDERYKHLVGKRARLPLLDRRIPIIADEHVDPSFGTGAVKITPGHDPNDFEVARRHNLPSITVIDQEAKMTEEAGSYAGLDRYACRERVVQDLKAGGYLEKIEDHVHAVGHCYRCGTVIEPLISLQWFVKMKPLALPALKVVQEGKLRFIPERFTKIYINWLENIKDWCISRQLWWGHRIPVWYCQQCGEEICALEDPAQCPSCGSTALIQDPDVLDTWFSSALWPFATLRWPEKTPELQAFYPTDLLVTGRDIIFFWVARMVMMGLEFMGEVPFREVLIHGLILDAQGRKMSKSRGTGIDPLEVLDKYGADTLRYMLITGSTPGNDVRFHPERLEGVRNFANKIWNAARFALMNLKDFEPGPIAGDQLELADRWILSRLQNLILKVDSSLESYEVGKAAQSIYEFLWGEFCDWYVELVKPRLYGSGEARKVAQRVLVEVLGQTLLLLHPFMPFITEEIWQHLPGKRGSIMFGPWPQPEDKWRDEALERLFDTFMEVTRAIRNLRSEMNVSPGKSAPVILVAEGGAVRETLAQLAPHLERLAWASQVEIREELPAPPAQAATAVAGGVEIYLPLAGLIDLAKERARLEKELAEVLEELGRSEEKLARSDFRLKAPPEVVKKEQAKAEEMRKKREAIERRLMALR